MNTIEKLLQGSIDMHIHYGPDPTLERRCDALEGARQSQAAGMRAIVLKSHEYPTAPMAHIISQVVPGILVYGSVCLDIAVGGLNPHALETSAKLGARVVWMPTYSAAYDAKKKKLSKEGVTIFDQDGKLLPVIAEILDIIKSHRMVLATGHISPPESFALIDEAIRKGISNIVFTHAIGDSPGTCYLSLEEQRRVAEKGVIIEHCFSRSTPLRRLDPMEIVEAVRGVGAEHCILSTGFGQAVNPTPTEGMRMAIATMLACGLTEKEIELMVKVNPGKLLGLD